MPSLRWLAPAALLLVAAAAGRALPSEPTKPPGEILTSLFRNISPDDLDYDAGQRLAELEEALDSLRAVAAEDPSPASCDRYCEARAPVLEKSCATLLQPTAARSRALCHARILEMNAQCRAGCRS